MSPRDPSARKGEIEKAGRLFFDAVFGEPGALERSVRDELAAEEHHERRDRAPTTTAIAPAVIAQVAPPVSAASAALPPSTIRCDDCGREQSIPASFSARDVERLGWRRVARAWRCSFCTD
ncbi:MAG: hypothetical protein ACHREM_01615 [Polyangiales bacterium]